MRRQLQRHIGERRRTSRLFEVQLEKFDPAKDNDRVVVETDYIWRTIYERSREATDFVLQELAAKRQSAYIAAKGILG